MAIEELYCSTPGINRELHIGTLTGPQILKFLQSYSQNNDAFVKSKLLLNCHTPEFNKLDEKDWNLEEHVEKRLGEYSQAGINQDNTYFYRDDKSETEMLDVLSKLIDKGYYYIKDDSVYFNINKAKEDFLENELFDKVSIYPPMFKNQFKSYLFQKEKDRILSRDLAYGLTNKTLGFDKPLSQVQELILFSSMSESEKLIVTGKNVLGHYGFQTLLLNSLMHESPTSLLVHSTYKIPKYTNLFETDKKVITYADLSSLSDEFISESQLVNMVLLTALTEQERAVIDEAVLSKVKKTYLKWLNINNLANKNNTTIQNLASNYVPEGKKTLTINSLLEKYADNFLDKLHFETILTSKLCSSELNKKTRNMLFQAKNYDLGETINILRSIFHD